MKNYKGTRRDGNCEVLIREPEYIRGLPIRRDLRNHSPTGYEWGYEGSGPAQLALALCADVLGDDQRAMRVYQEFKRHVVARLPRDGWSLNEDEILRHVELIESERADRTPVEGAARAGISDDDS